MGVIVLDSEFYIEGVDRHITQLFGYEHKEFCGQALSLFIPDFDKEKYKVEQGFINTKEIEQQAKTKSGDIFGLTYDVNEISQQEKTSYIVTIDELAATPFDRDRRQPNASNHVQGHEWLTYLLRASPVVIYSCIPSGQYPTTFISENIETLTGYTPEEYLADPSFWLHHLHPDDTEALLAEMSELFDTDKSLSYEYRFLCADGSYVWVLDKLKVSYDDQGNPSEMLGLWLDITQRKNDEELQVATNLLLKKKTGELEESNAELSQFTFVVSHDLKAPLRAIHSYCEWLSEDLDEKLEPEQQEYITGMQDAVQEAEILIEDLLELSRVGRRAVDVESIDLTEFLRNLTKKILVEAQVEIEITENMPTIAVSPTILTQVFQNLLTNAFLYNKAEKKIIKISGCEAGDNYIVSIADNGIGIEEKYHDRIFQLFQRLHTKEEYEGTGIGLAIVHKAVIHLNWTIALNSSLNKGSTFAVAFPIEEIKS
ncbi:MAG: hypothetical protein COC04_06455 [Gammaproteobacteria bacterium]|nr:MAG: hypothetical protein COC04_06455 [Gammaproteobacteria bacterium]